MISNSSKRFLEAQLSVTGISRYFSGKIADAQPKPNPDGLLRACEKLGISREEAVFVGDSSFDLEAGKNAKIKTIILGRKIEKIEDIPRVI